MKKVSHNLSNSEENQLSLGEPGLTDYLSKPGTRFPLLKARLGLAGHSVVPLPVLDLGQVHHLGLGFSPISQGDKDRALPQKIGQ